MKIKIEEKSVRGFKHPDKGQKYYFDTKMSGFGVCVGHKTKTFFLQRTINHKTIRIKLGRYNEINCTQARNKALQEASLLQQGLHTRQQQESPNQTYTLQTLYDQFAHSLTARDKKSSQTEYPDILRRHFSDWLNTPINQITRNMIITRHHEITVNTGPSSANKSFRVLRALYNHIIGEDESIINPVDILSTRKLWNKENHRTVRLKDHQFAGWVYGCLTLPNPVIRHFLLFVLLNGLRRREAQELKWDDIDLTNNTFTIRKTKNKRPLTLPITPHTRHILDALLHLKINDFVFPSSTSKSGHLEEPKKSVDTINKQLDTHITIHDLRRTFVSTANNLLITPYTIKQLINHSIPDVTSIYVSDDVTSLAKPLTMIQDKILNLSNLTPDSLKQSLSFT